MFLDNENGKEVWSKQEFAEEWASFVILWQEACYSKSSKARLSLLMIQTHKIQVLVAVKLKISP